MHVKDNKKKQKILDDLGITRNQRDIDLTTRLAHLQNERRNKFKQRIIAY